MKKFVGLLIMLLMIFSVSTPAKSVTASNLSDSIVLQLSETHTETQIDINVKLVTNTGISSLTLELAYNKDVFEFQGYERGTALSSFNLIATDYLSNPSLPIKFNWFNQSKNGSNNISRGNLLKLHFTLKPDAPSGDYEFGFNTDNNQIEYYEGVPKLKSAIISKAVVKISDNNISETDFEKIKTDNSKKHSVSLILIIGSTLFAVSVITTVTIIIVIRIKKEKRKKEKWLEI